MRMCAHHAYVAVRHANPPALPPQSFLVKEGEAQMQLHAGDRYQLQPGAQLRFGALLCRVQFSHQPVPPSEQDDRGDETDQAPTVAVDPDATQVPRCDLASSI